MNRYVKSSKDNACIGIWWCTDDNQIWGVSCPTDEGELCGMYMQYSLTANHQNLWNSIVADNCKDKTVASNIRSKGYRGLERGRVLFNTATMVYEITCSESLAKNKEAIQNIFDFYQLSENRVDICPLSHYNKIEFTGNPAVDAQIENNQY